MTEKTSSIRTLGTLKDPKGNVIWKKLRVFISKVQHKAVPTNMAESVRETLGPET